MKDIFREFGVFKIEKKYILPVIFDFFLPDTPKLFSLRFPNSAELAPPNSKT